MPSRAPPAWVRLGLSREEWDDCRIAALELAMAGDPSVSARRVAVELAEAKGLDVERLMGEPPNAGAARLIQRSPA